MILSYYTVKHMLDRHVYMFACEPVPKAVIDYTCHRDKAVSTGF